MWSNKKYPGVLFDGDYVTKNGKRKLRLEGWVLMPGKKIVKTFKSHQEAKLPKNGWTYAG